MKTADQDSEIKDKDQIQIQKQQHQSHMQDHQKPEASYSCQAQLKFASVELDLS